VFNVSQHEPRQWQSAIIRIIFQLCYHCFHHNSYNRQIIWVYIKDISCRRWTIKCPSLVWRVTKATWYWLFSVHRCLAAEISFWSAHSPATESTFCHLWHRRRAQTVHLPMFYTSVSTSHLWVRQLCIVSQHVLSVVVILSIHIFQMLLAFSKYFRL